MCSNAEEARVIRLLKDHPATSVRPAEPIKIQEKPASAVQAHSIEWILRIGLFGTFLGHGILAYQVKPAWVPYLTLLGFTKSTAAVLMKIIGVSDLVVACFALLKPIRMLLIWAVLWAFATAIIRPLSGEALLDFIERTANWCIPLALLAMHGFPGRRKSLWRIY
ncbi:MAG TPA: hypothetical protein VGO45_01485 [Bacteroidia bacterium]|nr:hypothetical protein [Bacteroidia bacterium]